jgi:Aldehyde dehydrogenase family
VNVKNEMTLAREEIFGLVPSVIGYDSEEEAIAIANDSKAGRVVNNGMTDDPRLPGVDSNTPASAENIAGTGSRRFSNPGLSPRREGKH